MSKSEIPLSLPALQRDHRLDLPSREGRRGPAGDSMPRYSVLVPCGALILSGGLLRFAHLGRKLAEQGHRLCFVPFTEQAAPDFRTALPVLSLDESARRKWDAVMIPGAGFADEVIEQFATFRDPRYGVRVQHILNDQSRKERFIKVNQAFRPEIVIFNNPQWAPGEHPELRAERFYHLFGAVDTRQFYPKPYGQHYGAKKSWVIGGLSDKNPGPLIEVLESLPKTYHVRLFGPKGHLERAYATLVQDGRLQLVGPLPTDALIAFYHAVDCVVHTEEFAGWANLVAEAMACGLPVICTRHGTKVFATHGQNAIVLDGPNPERIAEAVLRLSKNPIRCERLATAGRHTMMNFSWDQYAQRLLHLVFDDAPADTTDWHHPAPRHVTATGVKEKPRRVFISYPKSGRTWLRYILTELQLTDEVRFHHDAFEFNDGSRPAHNFDEEARLKKYARDRIVLLRRDPRDVMVSLFYQITGRFRDFFGYEGTIST